MSETVPDTFDASIKNLLGSIAFVLLLVGGELMAERDGVRFGSGAILAAMSVPFYLSAAIWTHTKRYLSDRLIQTLGSVATDARWLLGLLLVLVVFIAFWPISNINWFVLGAIFVIGIVALGAIVSLGRKTVPLAKANFVDVDSPQVKTNYSSDKIHIANFYAENPLKLRSDRLIVFIIRIYNANDVEFAINGISGAIHCSQSSGTPIQLQPVDLQNLMIGADSEKTLPSFKESRLILLVHAPAKIADEMQKAVENTPGINFSFQDVNVQLHEPVSNTNVRLPLWDGIGVHRSGIWSGRIISASVNERLSPKDSS